MLSELLSSIVSEWLVPVHLVSIEIKVIGDSSDKLLEFDGGLKNGFHNDLANHKSQNSGEDCRKYCEDTCHDFIHSGQRQPSSAGGEHRERPVRCTDDLGGTVQQHGLSGVVGHNRPKDGQE
jgi:hypothetical protein